MTRDDFVTLPLQTALGLIWDVDSSKLQQMDRPSVPKSPKYDDRFPKKKGSFVWVSEMTLEDLTWWRGKKAESAASGSEWAEKDAKWVTKLDKWIEWRRLFPSEVWSGTRGEDRATATPPTREPALHAWPARNGSPKPQTSPSPENDGREDEEQSYGF
jgi:hypothetical protein